MLNYVIINTISNSSIEYLVFAGSLQLRKMSDKDPLDGPPFIAGCITLLRQFHSDHTESFLAYMGQYIRSLMEAQISSIK